MAAASSTVSSKQAQASEEGIVQEKCINEEYKIWKKNSPFLYDLIITRALEWPCMSLEWCYGQEVFAEKGYSQQEMLLAARASQNKYVLAKASVQLPYLSPVVKASAVAEEAKENSPSMRVKINKVYGHTDSLLCARMMPQDPSCVLTIGTRHNDILLFDKSSFEACESSKNGNLVAKHRFKKHTQPCSSVCWNNVVKHQFVSGSKDTTVCSWDINAISSEPESGLIHCHTTHEKAVTDVKFHPLHGSLIGSVSQDQFLHIHDIRRPDSSKPLRSVRAHNDSVNSLSFNPLNEFVIATASSDKTIALWDLRNLNHRLYTLEGHEDSVLKVAFSPHEEPVLASISADRRTLLWDLSRIGEEQPSDEVQDGAPELLFMHGGHTSCAIDMGWCPNYNWTLATAAEDNILQIWTPSRSIWGNELMEEETKTE
ncbi:Clr6 histone deacetylase complex subunit Prw1 [Schizosaccharomyces japonicus yFS275]|uniref:Clr6 histone deacetylase complex subunit Prw1 n=1 Tax=Schizosaccharomyces japonicus (strain yFS275 / FY16936) TaxID=402676 RepID=B6K7P1_SCHJY|nr:Clr6 histone deacetylase complex subunit Prw1 [Schizosaccharomyces japonicus yFS275]EEB09545.1 Clr6 histone deacetylase complex subunit Prw1 [Schizosaccharomyces japonicus yFS275]